MNYLLDTNIYRNLFGETDELENQKMTNRIISFAKEKNITFLTSTIVITELLMHLDNSDSAREKCHKALTCLYNIHGEKITPIQEFKEIISLFFGKKVRVRG